MRILLACPYAWNVAGGVQAHIRELATALAARGYQVAIVAPVRGPVRDAPGAQLGTVDPLRLVDARVPTRVASSPPAVHLVGRTFSLPWGGTVVTLCWSPRSLWRVRRVVAAFRPDVVHVHEPFAPGTSIYAALAARGPVVATFHAFSARSRTMVAFTPLLRIVCRRIGAAFAVSEAAADLGSRVFTRPISILPNGVDIERFARPRAPAPGVPTGRVVLWVHRLEPRKGFVVALRAFARLAADLDDAHLVVIGEGSAQDALARLPDELRRRVVMLGPVPYDDLPRYHAAADVFVAPATGQESFGISLVEAMAAGLPVVASDIRGYRNVVRHGVDGLLVPPGDPDALAVALRRVLTDRTLADTLARGGRKRARRYSWDVLVPRLDALYARLAPAAATRAAREAAAVAATARGSVTNADDRDVARAIAHSHARSADHERLPA